MRLGYARCECPVGMANRGKAPAKELFLIHCGTTAARAKSGQAGCRSARRQRRDTTTSVSHCREVRLHTADERTFDVLSLHGAMTAGKFAPNREQPYVSAGALPCGLEPPSLGEVTYVRET